MKRLPVDFSKTSSFPKIFLDYIDRKDTLSRFYKYTPDISSFKKVIEDKSKEAINRQILVEVLREQNKNLGAPNEIQLAAIDSLLSDKTFTVTTGHQLCIFTGPLYSIYKILSTIKLAQELKKQYPDCNFVPVFWMVTEDHDFEEINHINIFGKKIAWNPSGEQEALAGKVAVGALKCDGLDALIEEVKGVLGESENAVYLLNLFRSVYFQGASLADATRVIMHKLLGKYGLVILDASDKRLKKLYTDVMKEDVLKSSSCNYVNKTIEQFGADYKAQVHPREINLFYLDKGARNRIVKEGEGYIVLNSDKKFTEAQLLSEIDSAPENFSPNVVLRPLYQERILPNVAYVGGPGEISYWLEYKAMFEHFRVNYPVLVLRNCAMWLDEGSVAKIEKLGIKPEDVFAETESLIKLFLERNFDHAFSLEEETKQIVSMFSSIGERVGEVDVTLKGTVEAEKQKQLNALKALEDKITRAQKKKHEISVNQVRKLKEKLFPENTLQERYENFMPYYLKYGEKYFDLLLENFDALPAKFLVLAE